jgi:hypothetical protein
MKRLFIVLACGFLLEGLAGWAAEAQEAQPPTKPRRAVVTLDGRLEALPDLSATDFLIEAGKEKMEPTRIYRPDELPTLIAIVLQENQSPDFGAQLPILRDFILGQPPNTYVGLFYLSAQSVDYAAPFASNLQKVAEALRTPKGKQELAPPSPYEPLGRIAEFMDKLPDARKEILLFSEGSDALAGDSSASQNRYLARAVQVAQEAGIPVWTIYVQALPPRGRLINVDEPPDQRVAPPLSGSAAGSLPGPTDPFADSRYTPNVDFGSSYLTRLAENTGGKVYSAGKFAPDIAPFLEEFQRLLAQQFVLELPGAETPKKIKLHRKIAGVKLLYPHR